MSKEFEDIHDDVFNFLEKLNNGPYGRAKKILDLQNSILERAYAEASEEGGSTKLLNLITRNIRNRVESTRVGDNPSFDIGKLFAYPKMDDKASIAMSKVYGEMQRFGNVMNMASSKPITVGDDDQYAFGADTGVKADFQYLADEEKEQRERTSRRSIARRRQKINLAKLDMSDYDLFVHEHKAEYGGTKGADEAYRKMLLKQLPPFFKDSKLSTKSLLSMQQVLKSTRGIPVVGPTLHKMISNPVAGGAGLLYAGTIAAFAASDRANKDIVAWQNAANLYGMPNKKFMMAGFRAGYKDPGSISKVYGELTARFGNADMFIQSFGKSFGNMTPLARTLVAKQLGLDENTVALIDILSGNKHLPVNETRAINANKNIVETTKTLNLQSGGSVWDFLQGAWDSIPGMSSGKARDMHSFKSVEEGVTSDMFEGLDETVRKTHEAAESLDESEASGDQGSVSQNNSKNVAMNVYVAKVESPDPVAFKDGLENMADGALDGNRALLASFGSGFTV